ncbi:MAG: nucleotidyltransferase domain-containing protein [Ignisphaera sp.]
MSKEFEAYIIYAKELERFFRNLQSILSSVKRDIEKVEPRSKVYLFGSVARGWYTYASDVDILVVLENLGCVDVDALKIYIKSRYRGYPIELHIVDRQTFEKWYKRFIKPEELIEIT